MSEREYSKSVHLTKEHHKIIKRRALNSEVSIERELEEIIDIGLASECE